MSESLSWMQTGDAYLQQVDSNIKGDKITYLVKEQKMQAFSDKGKRVTTVLVPSQLQDKNNKGQTTHFFGLV
jgi:lipopolysaccharide export system protein LptA